MEIKLENNKDLSKIVKFLENRNYIEFIKGIVIYFFPKQFILSSSQQEQARIVQALNRFEFDKDQLLQMKFLIEKLGNPISGRLYFMPTNALFSKKAFIVIAAMQEFLNSRKIVVFEDEREEFEKNFHICFTDLGKFIKEEVEGIVKDYNLHKVLELAEVTITRIENNLYDEGRFFYINLFNIFYIQTNLDLLLPQKEYALSRLNFEPFLSHKRQMLLAGVPQVISNLQETTIAISRIEKPKNDNNAVRPRKFSISGKQKVDDRNSWYLNFERYIKSDLQSILTLRAFFWSSKFLAIFNQYNKSIEESGNKSKSGVGRILEKLDTKNRESSQLFINDLVAYYTSLHAGNINQEFAQFLLLLSSILSALRTTPVSLGQGKGNHLARYLVTTLWNGFGVTDTQDISSNNKDNQPTLSNNLYYLQHLLLLQAFIIDPESINHPVTNAVTHFIEEPIHKEPDGASHSKKIEFAFEFTKGMIKAKNSEEYVKLFEKINVGIELSRSTGGQERSHGLEDHLVALRDSLILAIVERRFVPQAGQFTSKDLIAISHAIATPLDVSLKTIPLFEHIVCEFSKLDDEQLSEIYTHFCTSLFKVEGTRNGQKIDLTSYIVERVNGAVALLDKLYAPYQHNHGLAPRSLGVFSARLVMGLRSAFKDPGKIKGLNYEQLLNRQDAKIETSVASSQPESSSKGKQREDDDLAELITSLSKARTENEVASSETSPSNNNNVNPG